jgi:hypothetical protein
MSVNEVNSWMNQPGGLTESGGRITCRLGIRTEAYAGGTA